MANVACRGLASEHPVPRKSESVRKAAGRTDANSPASGATASTTVSVSAAFSVKPSPSATIRRRKAESRGRDAEAFVAEHWQSQGFDILAQRLRTKAGEIDLIVADPSTLVFVEVKSRKTTALAAHSVLPRQQSRLFQAADTVLAEHEAWSRPNIRFDIALVCNGTVEHIHDAIRQY